MGFSTNITIQNDFFHEVQKDPQKLVDAISVVMSDGDKSDPLPAVWADRDSREDRPRRWDSDEARWARRNYVAIHKTQHNDIPQVIVSIYGSHAIAAHEIPYAIESGWLDLGGYNEKHAEEVAKELTRLARDIRGAVKAANAKREET